MPDETPLVAGEIDAWRAWRVIGNKKLPMLSSVSRQNTIWHPGRWTLADCYGSETCQNMATEQYDPKTGRVVMVPTRLPGEGCSCGLYAARDREHLVQLGYNRGHDDKPVFIGIVGFAGKVIPGTQGWRAEKGRIKKLYVPHRHWEYVEALRNLYRCEVELDNTFNP